MCCYGSCYAKDTSVRCYRQCYKIRLGCLLSLVMRTLLGVCRSQESLFELRFLRVYFSSEVLSQEHIFTKTPKYCHSRAKLVSVFGKYLLKREYLGWNSLKWCNNGLLIGKLSSAKGMFSTKISLAKGIRSKTWAAHPLQNFSEYHPTPPSKSLVVSLFGGKMSLGFPIWLSKNTWTPFSHFNILSCDR